MDNNGQQWTTMDNNGQQTAVLHASLMPLFINSDGTQDADKHFCLAGYIPVCLRAVWQDVDLIA